jgi:hypothetical protein
MSIGDPLSSFEEEKGMAMVRPEYIISKTHTGCDGTGSGENQATRKTHHQHHERHEVPNIIASTYQREKTT